jgi:hypothetical protein
LTSIATSPAAPSGDDPSTRAARYPSMVGHPTPAEARSQPAYGEIPLKAREVGNRQRDPAKPVATGSFVPSRPPAADARLLGHAAILPRCSPAAGTGHTPGGGPCGIGPRPLGDPGGKAAAAAPAVEPKWPREEDRGACLLTSQPFKIFVPATARLPMASGVRDGSA